MNGSITEFLDSVKDALSKSPFLSESMIISGFSSSIKDIPLRRSIIALSIGSMELCDGAVGRYYGKTEEGQELYGRRGIIGINLTIAVPKLLGGEVCNEVLNDLTSAVISCEFGTRVISLKAGEVKAERELGALTVPVTLTIDAIITADQQDSAGEPFRKAVVKLN